MALNSGRIQFQDVLVIQMLAGCTSGVSSALIGWYQADHILIGLHPHYYTHPTIRPDISFYTDIRNFSDQKPSILNKTLFNQVLVTFI